MPPQFVLLAVFLSLPAYGTIALTPHCLTGFVMVADTDGIDVDALIDSTFADLYDRLGAGKVSTETLDRWIAGGKPFEFPNQPGTDLEALRKNLQDFEKLINAKEWNQPAMRERLIAKLKEWRAGQTEAEKKVDQAVRNSEQLWPDHEVPEMRTVDSMAVSPDGRWMVRNAGGIPGSPYELLVYDTQTKQKKLYPRPERHTTAPHFTSDGELVFGLAGTSMLRVPFANGVPNYAKAVTMVGPPTKAIVVDRVFIGKSPDYVYYNDRDFILRFDRRTNGYLKLKTQELLPENAFVPGRGVIPGTDQLYFVVGEDSQIRLRRVETDADGNLKEVATQGSWKIGPVNDSNMPDNFEWSSDGKIVYAFGNRGRSEVTMVKAPGAVPELLFSAPPSTDPLKFYIYSVALDPKGQWGAILYVIHDEPRIKLFDAQTHEILGDFKAVPDTSQIAFTPDGKTLLTSTAVMTKMTAVNPERHIPVEKLKRP